MNVAMTKDWIQLAPGVRRKTAAVGEKMMQVMVWFDKGAKVSEHSHVHEQMTSVVSGRMKFVIAGEPREIAGGGAVALKSNVPHSAEAIEDSLLLDTFCPPREDLLRVDEVGATPASPSSTTTTHRATQASPLPKQP